MLVRADVFRGRFRNGYDTPVPFVPGEPSRVSFELQDLLHTFSIDAVIVGKQNLHEKPETSNSALRRRHTI